MAKENPIVALVQHPPVFLNLRDSIKKAVDLIREAAAHSADLIFFPETWLPGYPVWLDYAPKAALWDHQPAKTLYRLLAENAITLHQPMSQNLLQAASSNKVTVVMGAHEKAGGSLYNTMLFIGKDGSFRAHRKIMPTYTERLIWGAGDASTLETLEMDWGSLSGLICWEHWMPLLRAAMHAKKEAIHVAQWPYVKELHQLCSRHYAFEGQCFVAASGGILTKKDIIDGLESLNLNRDERHVFDLIASMPGDDNQFMHKGGSALIAPDSSYVIEPVYDEVGIFYAEADMNLITEGNLHMDSDGHYSRPDLFNLQIDTSPQKNVTFFDGDEVSL